MGLFHFIFFGICSNKKLMSIFYTLPDSKPYLVRNLNVQKLIEDYLEVYNDKVCGMTNFKLLPKQHELLNNYLNNRLNVVPKSRQVGATSITAAYIAIIAAYANCEQPEEIIIVCSKYKLAKMFLEKVKTFLSQLPLDVLDKSKSKVDSLTLSNGSTIKALSTSLDALRGLTPSHMVVDNAAYIDTFPRELYNTLMASLVTGGSMIVMSSSNGKDEIFYKIYDNAKNKTNNFKITFARWYEDPRFNTNLVWKIIGYDGELHTVVEEEFTQESFSKMVKKGYKPFSPWYIKTCSILQDSEQIERELNIKFE